jgi:hypothetical protein
VGEVPVGFEVVDEELEVWRDAGLVSYDDRRWGTGVTYKEGWMGLKSTPTT